MFFLPSSQPSPTGEGEEQIFSPLGETKGVTQKKNILNNVYETR